MGLAGDGGQAGEAVGDDPLVAEGAEDAQALGEALRRGGGVAGSEVDLAEIVGQGGDAPLVALLAGQDETCLLYTSPSPRDKRQSRMPSSA